jgi:hypothetical protein
MKWFGAVFPKSAWQRFIVIWTYCRVQALSLKSNQAAPSGVTMETPVTTAISGAFVATGWGMFFAPLCLFRLWMRRMPADLRFWGTGSNSTAYARSVPGKRKAPGLNLFAGNLSGVFGFGQALPDLNKIPATPIFAPLPHKTPIKTHKFTGGF